MRATPAGSGWLSPCLVSALAAIVPVMPTDALGYTYDSSFTDAHGVVHYQRNRANGTARGPAYWSSEHDCNPVCGCHLAMKCSQCSGCLTCDGCYCGEGYD